MRGLLGRRPSPAMVVAGTDIKDDSLTNAAIDNSTLRAKSADTATSADKATSATTATNADALDSFDSTAFASPTETGIFADSIGVRTLAAGRFEVVIVDPATNTVVDHGFTMLIP